MPWGRTPPAAPSPDRWFAPFRPAPENPRVTLTIQLVQGTTVIAAQDVSPATREWVSGAFVLSAAEADSITDYADLRLRLIATGADGAAVAVSWLAWVVPVSTGPPVQTLAPAGIASAEQVGAAAVTPGDVTIAPAGIASSEQASAPRLDQALAPAGIASGEQGAAAAVSLRVAPAGLPSAETVGPATVTPGAVTLVPAGIPSGEQRGAATLTQVLAPAGIPSAEQGGAPTLALTLAPPASRVRNSVARRPSR
jgi:hypothetical protein